MAVLTGCSTDTEPVRPSALVLVTGDGAMVGALPPFEVDTPWWQDAEAVVRGARDRLGVDVTILRMLAAERAARPAEP